ncbi:MAG: hypothetical protein AAF961_10460, partial [Planctomycetota bacterium]
MKQAQEIAVARSRFRYQTSRATAVAVGLLYLTILAETSGANDHAVQVDRSTATDVTAEPLFDLASDWDLDRVDDSWGLWTTLDLRQPASMEIAPTFTDDLIAPTQATSPSPGGVARPLRLRTAQRTRTARTSQRRSPAGPGVSLGLASVPFMIGDTGAGTCFS